MTEKAMLRLALAAIVLALINGALFGAGVTALMARIHDRADDARIASLEAGPIAAPFTDTVGPPYAAFIEQIRLAGLTAGCSTDPAMFCPDRPLTRGEAAVFMARLLELAR